MDVGIPARAIGSCYKIRQADFARDVSTGFIVCKKQRVAFDIAYQKHDNQYHYIVGAAQVSGCLNQIKVHGSTNLREVYSDAQMVAQAKKVLEW